MHEAEMSLCSLYMVSTVCAVCGGDMSVLVCCGFVTIHIRICLLALPRLLYQ